MDHWPLVTPVWYSKPTTIMIDLQLQSAHIKSQWRESWRSAPVVNSHLVPDPTVQKSGFDLPSMTAVFSSESFPHCTVSLRCLHKEVVPIARPRWCLALSTFVLWQSWMLASHLHCASSSSSSSLSSSSTCSTWPK